MTPHKNLIFLLGPTASGKSALAMRMAQTLGGEIISVDSMAVYRGMDIGTAKPDTAARQKVPHHLIDICEPLHHYSVAEFCHNAQQAIATICEAGRIPILCGGTMFYFQALEHGLSPLPPNNPELRKKIQQRLQDKGVYALHEWLEELDSESAQRIHPNDSQRLQRAIEIHLLSGKTMSEMKPPQGLSFDGQIHRIAINVSDRKVLRQRIEKRFLQMLKDGICDELKNLLVQGRIDPQSNAMRGVGYRQVWQYLSGQLNYQDMQQRAVYASCQLAKRQITWMRKMENLCYYHIDTEDQEDIALQIEKMITIGVE